MIRLVFGLGTRAVNRVGGDYPRMIAVSHPELRSEIGRQIQKYSQKNIDLIDLETNEFATYSVHDILEKLDYPNLHLLISTMSEEIMSDWPHGYFNISPEHIFLTFNTLVKKTNMVTIFDEILNRLETAWGQPIDTEFTVRIDKNDELRINLLQCRPLMLPRIPDSPTTIPENLNAQNVLFKTDKIISGGIVDSIRYIIYIDPNKYAELEALSGKRSIGRVVGKLNQYFRDREEKVMALGPGRWGSNNIDLGVNVKYSDIDNITVLVEVSYASAINEPDLSYGTHFSQDLVEANIIYMHIFPNKHSTQFNEHFFNKSPNLLTKILPEYQDYKNIVKVVDVSLTHKNTYAHLIADGRTRKAICYLKNQESSETS
jgi:hypothetical protein